MAVGIVMQTVAAPRTGERGQLAARERSGWLGRERGRLWRSLSAGFNAAAGAAGGVEASGTAAPGAGGTVGL